MPSPHLLNVVSSVRTKLGVIFPYQYNIPIIYYLSAKIFSIIVFLASHTTLPTSHYHHQTAVGYIIPSNHFDILIKM